MSDLIINAPVSLPPPIQVDAPISISVGVSIGVVNAAIAAAIDAAAGRVYNSTTSSWYIVTVSGTAGNEILNYAPE